MDELDGVLHGDDVVVTMVVGIIHHRGQGRRFAAARGARDQDKPFLVHGGLRQDRRQPQVLRRNDLARDQTEDGRAAIFLLEEIRPEARHAGDLVAEVHVAGLLVLLDLDLRGDLVEHRLELVVLRTLYLMRSISPRSRMMGCWPETRCRSEAPWSNISLKNASILAMGGSLTPETICVKP